MGDHYQTEHIYLAGFVLIWCHVHRMVEAREELLVSNSRIFSDNCC